MLPDPGFFAECLRTAFAELQEAAAREATLTVAEAAALEPGAAPVIEGKVVRRARAKPPVRKSSVRKTQAAKAPAVKRRAGRRKTATPA